MAGKKRSRMSVVTQSQYDQVETRKTINQRQHRIQMHRIPFSFADRLTFTEDAVYLTITYAQRFQEVFPSHAEITFGVIRWHAPFITQKKWISQGVGYPGSGLFLFQGTRASNNAPE
jgi:hypothetical protein